ncbi:hypothetical protein MMC11_004940 [Xylographa trunciseda]|nr:hypothetical protein [Xylographa trunciseda]
MDLPTLDFSKFHSGSRHERSELGHDIVKSFNNHGFVKLTNYGVPEDVVSNLLKTVPSIYLLTLAHTLTYSLQTKRLFDMPQEAKTRIVNIPGPHPQRGWSWPKFGIETLSKGAIKRTWSHTDFGIITLLFQDGVDGLELEDRKAPGTFVPVPPGESNTEMIVNISDTFQRWTNGTIRAGLHQVSIPSSMKVLKREVCPDRYSNTSFFKAHRNTSDFFYACRGHLKDRGFCSPVVDEAAKKKEEMDREIELVKKEYEEKLARKKKAKDKKDLKGEGQEEKSAEAAAVKEAEQEKDDKARAENLFQ